METQQLNFVNKCPFIVKLISIILICNGLAVLLGWLFLSPSLTSISFIWTSEKIIVPVCFILSGFALLFSHNNDGLVSRNIAAILSIIILLISSVCILEFMSGMDFGSLQLFTKDLFNSEALYTGSISFVIAINFILVSLALLFNKHISGLLNQIIAFSIFFVALFSLYNYVFDANLNYSLAANTTMTVNSALLFILLSTGILLLKPDSGIIQLALQNNTAGYYTRRILPAMLLVLTLVTVIENKMEKLRLVEANLGDSIIAAGTFVILSIVISIIIRRIDREEKRSKEAVIQVQQNEIIFHQFLENIDIVFFKTTPDSSKILYINHAYEKIWGRSVESLYKNPMEWYECILPEDKQLVYDEFFEGMRQGKASAYAEYRIKKPDGSIRNIIARCFQLKDQNNNPFCITGIAIDMTEVKQEKSYLHIRDTILKIIENEKSINSAAPIILKMICQISNWDLGAIWLIDETKDRLQFVNNWHVESDNISQYNKISSIHTFKSGEDLPGLIWQEKRTIWIADYSKRREFLRSLEAEKAGLNCALGVPIIFQDKIYGIMEFFSFIIQTPDEAMIGQLSDFGKLIGEFAHRLYTNDQIKILSRRDILTGLLNRSAIEEDLNYIINNLNLKIIAILIVDIDKFSLVNEALGHVKGDVIIQSAAKRLEKLVDQDKTHAARIGDNKFILCYLKAENIEDIIDYAHQIERSFKEPFIIDQNEISLTVSVGVSVYPQNGNDSKTLIENADQALTYAKNDGGNKSILFTNELHGITLEKLNMHVDLHQAITKNQFLLFYQPQIDLKTGNICGAEALVRWRHPVKGIIFPEDFISYAEQAGLTVALNEHILRMVFQQVKSGWTGPPISVNISANQFKEKYHFVEYIESLMKEFSVEPKHIEFEITESFLMEDTQHNIAVLAALNQLGFQFAIDDFGTGFSSFNYVYRIPARKVKIDKSFITGLPENQANATIVKSMLALLHSLGKLVVAEGAENKSEIEFLTNEKCDIVQGYYYYKPLSTEDFISLITKEIENKS